MKLRFWKKPEPAAPEPEQLTLEEAATAPAEPAVPEPEKPAAAPGPTTEPVSRPEPEEAPLVQEEGPRECLRCGAEVETNARFCTQCATPLAHREGAKVMKGKAGADEVEPWARKAGESVSKMPRSVKIGVPLFILLIIAILVTLFVLAGTHSPEAAVNRYLGNLKAGDYKAAYDLVAHPGGKFSSFDFFQKWQNTQTNAIGSLDEFTVQKRKLENKLFGKLITDVPTTGVPFVATLKYKDKTYDANMTVEDAGGTWPVKRWRLKLTGGSSRVLVTPIGSSVFIDGVPIGKAEPNKDLADALELKHFPKDIDGAVDYAKKLVKTVQFLLSEFKRLAVSLETVTESAQHVVDRFGTSGFTWSDLLDTANSTVQQSKDFGQDVAMTAIHIYWIFGGGDDGSLRSRLTRVESEIDVNNLPEGYHVVRATLPGADPDSKEFVSPQEVQVELVPKAETENILKNTMVGFYAETANAEFTLNTVGLQNVMDGNLLTEETNRVLDLMAKGQHIARQLTELKYDNIKLLSETVATVETHETWNIITYQGAAPVATLMGQKYHMIYTLEQHGDGSWKVIERRQL
jgi:hypothetical protein